MRMNRAFATALAAAAALAACVPRTLPPAPQPAPVPRPAPAPPPAPAAAPPPADWRDGPLTQGDWSLARESAIAQASFASPGGALFALRCDAGRQIGMFVIGGPGGPVTVTTSFGERTLPGGNNPEQALATLPASDPLFDEIAFSRGRFLVRVPGWSRLVLPTWPEPAWLIEDCRGQ